MKFSIVKVTTTVGIFVLLTTTVLTVTVEDELLTQFPNFQDRHIVFAGEHSDDDSIGPVPPLPECETIPSPPPRSEIKQFNATFAAQLKKYLVNTTVGPCKEGAHNPSSTALSGAFILGGKVDYFNFGCVDKTTPQKTPTTKTIYRLGSSTKTFAVETVIKAFVDGKIDSLDDELRKYFPEFYIQNPFGSSQPTFRQMISQLSGSPRGVPCQRPFCNITTSEMLGRISRNSKLMMPPWTKPSYSNMAYCVFSHLIAERLYNMPWSEFLDKHLVKPLGMKSTGVNYTSTVREKMVTNYLLNGDEAPFTRLGWVDPSGGVYSTSEDMATWILHYLNEWKENTPTGQLRRNTMMQMFQNPGGFSGFGAPWEIFSSHGYAVRTKSGKLSGLTTHMGMVPELDFGVILLWNGEGIEPVQNPSRPLFNAIIPSLRNQYVNYHKLHFPQLSDYFLDNYVGLYHGFGAYPVVNATAVPSLNYTLVANIDFGRAGVYYLKPQQSDDNSTFVFRIVDLQQQMSCLNEEIMANDGQWISFYPLSNGTKRFSLPWLQFANFTATF